MKNTVEQKGREGKKEMKPAIIEYEIYEVRLHGRPAASGDRVEGRSWLFFSGLNNFILNG